LPWHPLVNRDGWRLKITNREHAKLGFGETMLV